ncbi:tryptophan synthase beta subunit-like PLP-dependent enzyme [Gilbertella persicaria]|uniref:tryptophan synthase beta subunit-like PLP-dependent enzyme n=1 Tax=Gilbertella persicaria TaxID=101096 RepID=UPI00221E8B24|nr:tryptophan synthase beta subunit-like PLP-dependent enzyme [Gilbertella persicaria]KAI8054163.1 tryptophan synthase beta subunit-like PLP-dependent enzyme [Gilbertella persicaria]
MAQITLENIIQAAERIHVHRTPVLTCESMNEFASTKDVPVELYFKCELFQKTGSFKYRGASNAVAVLTDEEAANGVVCHSSGNHAQAIALAAKNRGVPAYIVMPNTTPDVKKVAVAAYGAHIIECEPLQSVREETAERVRKEKNASFIHPFNNPHVIAGQGTIALELLSQVNDLDAIIVPVGGGGMLTGCSIAAKSLRPDIKVYAAEPSLVDDCYRSFKKHERLTNAQSESVADGLLTNLGDIAYSEIHKHVDDVFTVTEKEIINTMELIWGRMKLCIEASAAVGVANQKDNVKRIGIILCGGNVDLVKATELFENYRK